MLPHAPDQPGDYFSHARTDIEPLLPPTLGRILEIGCGRGATLAWLKATRPCELLVGIELFAEAAGEARSHADHIECGDAEAILERVGARGPYDLVLCLDVLEHLVDPWQFVARVEKLLAPGGSLVISVPNVRHYRVSLPLLLLGRWRYESAGVLDRTHLRFFTREGARQLLDSPALQAARCRASRPPRGSGSWLANLMSAGLLSDLFAVQYMLAAQKRADAIP